MPAPTFYGAQLPEPYDGFPQGYASMIAEPKLPGIRVAAVIDGTGVAFYSAGPNPLPWAPNLAHVAAELLELGFEECMVDGQVFATPDQPMSLVTSGFRGKAYAQPTHEVAATIRRAVKYCPFDWVNFDKVRHIENAKGKRVAICITPLRERRAELAQYLRGAESVDIVRAMPSQDVTSERDVIFAYEHSVASHGATGLVLKFPESIYCFARTKAWRLYAPEP